MVGKMSTNSLPSCPHCRESMKGAFVIFEEFISAYPLPEVIPIDEAGYALPSDNHLILQCIGCGEHSHVAVQAPRFGGKFVLVPAHPSKEMGGIDDDYEDIIAIAAAESERAHFRSKPQLRLVTTAAETEG